MKNTPHSPENKYINNINDVYGMPSDLKKQLAKVADTYRFRANEYYLSLIDWDDPHDPIRRLIIPDPSELEQWGSLDPSKEENFTIIPGLEHKYPSTALLLVSNVCGGICRFCFRKRVFIHQHGQILTDLPAAAEYIQQHQEITNVLLTGGDPLILTTNELKKIVQAILPIEHIKILRIGTKMVAFNPYRILEDPELCKLITDCVSRGKQVYIMTHFNHARELTDVAIQAANKLRHAGALLANQTPLIHGVNDSPDVLADLFRKLSFNGIPPYYLFQCRPASGNKDYAVPIEQGYRIFEQAKARVSGLAKRARYVMSHVTGKVEIVGITDQRVYFKYHRAADDQGSGNFMVFQSNPCAYWFDDYDEIIRSCPVESYYKAYGPE